MTVITEAITSCIRRMPPPPDPLLGEQAACSSLRPSGFFNRKKDAFISRWDSFDISDRTHLNYVNKVEALKVYWALASVCVCFWCVCVCVCVCVLGCWVGVRYYFLPWDCVVRLQYHRKLLDISSVARI